MELTIPKARTVETDLGKFYYQSSILEAFCDELAKKWGVKLPDLMPVNDFDTMTNYILSKQIRDIPTRVRVSYFKDGTDKLAKSALREGETSADPKELAKVLYETSEPDHESAILIYGNKHVDIHFKPEGKKEVTFVDPIADEALRRVDRRGDISYLVNKNKGTRMDFSRTTNQDVHGVSSYITDMQNAIDVVRLYFKLDALDVEHIPSLVKVADPTAD